MIFDTYPRVNMSRACIANCMLHDSRTAVTTEQSISVTFLLYYDILANCNGKS